MAHFIIPLKNEDMKEKIQEAFAASFSNPNNLTAQGLVVKHIANYIKSIVNEHAEKEALENANQDAEKIDSID